MSCGGTFKPRTARTHRNNPPSKSRQTQTARQCRDSLLKSRESEGWNYDCVNISVQHLPSILTDWPHNKSVHKGWYSRCNQNCCWFMHSNKIKEEVPLKLSDLMWFRLAWDTSWWAFVMYNACWKEYNRAFYSILRRPVNCTVCVHPYSDRDYTWDCHFFSWFERPREPTTTQHWP